MSYPAHKYDDEPPSSSYPGTYTPLATSEVQSPTPITPTFADTGPRSPENQPSGNHNDSSCRETTEPQPPSERKARLSTTNTVLSTDDMRKIWSSGIHWYVPTGMITVFLVGCLSAVGHHLFYQSLDGEPAVNQLMMNRYGTALAFLTKASLVGSVVLAYRQRLWLTLRQKSISIRGLDALFSIVEDPSWFVMAPEILANAQIATIMALATWLIPISSVLSPGSLTAQLKEVNFPGSMCTVNSIDFSLEATSDWRKPRHGRAGYNMAFFNTTPPPPGGDIDWYDQPSYQADRIAKLSLYGDRIEPEGISPCYGYNCTYTTTFYGPWYNCSQTEFSKSPFSQQDFVPYSEPLPMGNNYVFQARIEDPNLQYQLPQPGYNDSAYHGQGVFRYNPPVWFGYAINTSKPIANATANSRWTFEIELRAFICSPQKAKYTVNSTWIDNQLESRIPEVTEGSDMLPPGEVLKPTPKSALPRYKEFVAYYAVGYLMRQAVQGYIQQDNVTFNVVTNSGITKTTRLVDQTTQWPVEDFGNAYQEFFQDLVLSYISEPFLEIAITNTVPCHRTRWENRFRYYPYGLWIGYALAIFVAFCSIIIGFASISRNGMCSDTTFSKILVTTRNPHLDRIVRRYPGVALGGDPIPKALEETRLRFGVVLDRGPDGNGRFVARHTAFGLEEETALINKETVLTSLSSRNESDYEMGNRRAYFPGAGLGALPG